MQSDDWENPGTEIFINIAADHRRNKKDFSGKSNGKYLSGFFLENHIRPVITFVSDRSDKADGRRIR